MAHCETVEVEVAERRFLVSIESFPGEEIVADLKLVARSGRARSIAFPKGMATAIIEAAEAVRR